MTTKRELVEAEDKSWHALAERIDRVADPEAPGLNGDWSVKDLLAHVAAWHAVTTDRLECLRSVGDLGKAPDVDAFNDKTHQECKDLSLHDVRVMSGAARHRFREEVALVEEPIDEHLARIIAANAHGHYDEHIPDLDRLLGSA